MGVSQSGGVTVSSYTDVPHKNVSQMKAALAQQPVAVAIEADQYVFQGYQSGVITSSSCGTNLDHGVLAVRYGTLNGQDYFLVKNSWGSSWVTRDTLESELTTSAVSSKWPPTQPPTEF